MFLVPGDTIKTGQGSRRVVDWAEFFTGAPKAWTDHAGKDSYGASVTWAWTEHNLSYLDGALVLELYLEVLTVGVVSSAKGHWSLMQILDAGMGVVVKLAEEPKYVLAKDEI